MGGGHGDSDVASIPSRGGTAISVVQLGARALGDHRIRYLIVGAGTNVLYFGLFWVGWQVLHATVPYLLVTALANFTTAVIMYPAYRGFVFGSTGGLLRGFAKFYTVYLLGLGIAVAGMPLLIEVFHTPVLLAQAVVIIVAPVAGYLLHRFWTFRDTLHSSVDADQEPEVVGGLARQRERAPVR